MRYILRKADTVKWIACVIRRGLEKAQTIVRSNSLKGAFIMAEHSYATDNADFQSLLSKGFSESEATKLIHMKNHEGEQVEYREMLEESYRLKFIRWLIEHDRIGH